MLTLILTIIQAHKIFIIEIYLPAHNPTRTQSNPHNATPDPCSTSRDTVFAMRACKPLLTLACLRGRYLHVPTTNNLSIHHCQPIDKSCTIIMYVLDGSAIMHSTMKRVGSTCFAAHLLSHILAHSPALTPLTAATHVPFTQRYSLLSTVPPQAASHSA